MLVLSRKSGERILIGDGITLMVVRIDGQQVRIGIEAPPEVTIVREELVEGREARGVLEKLVRRGELVVRGEKRGSYYEKAGVGVTEESGNGSERAND